MFIHLGCPEGEGRYHLDSSDNVDYSTNSYELFILYLKLFDYDKYKRIMYNDRFVRPRSTPEPCFPANHKSFLTGLEEEKRVYNCGYKPVLVKVTDKKGKIWYHTQWGNVSE